MEKEPTFFKKIKDLSLPNWKTLLSKLDVINVCRDSLTNKICQKFSQRETYQWHNSTVTYAVLTNYISYEANISYLMSIT